MENYKLSAVNNYLKKLGYSINFNDSIVDTHKLIIINDTPIYAKLANTPQLLEQGLMNVPCLNHNEGCLLDFKQESTPSLWMRNCKINLQAAFIDKNYKITEIINMLYEDPYRVHRSTHPIVCALEMEQDFFTKHKIKVGDKIIF